MRKIVWIVLVSIIIVGCNSEEKNSSSLKFKIEQQEKHLNQLNAEMRPHQKIPIEERDDLVALLENFYQDFPNNEYAPVCLEKLHMIFSSDEDYLKSTEYGSTLLDKYPNYKNRPLILESMAVNYDIFIQPRDTSKVRFYYEKLLKEDKNLSNDKKEGIKFKLDHLNLSIEELILKVND